MWSDLAFGPSFTVNNGSLALVSCLSGGYNLHWLSNVLGLVCCKGSKILNQLEENHGQGMLWKGWSQTFVALNVPIGAILFIEINWCVHCIIVLCTLN